MKTLTEVKKEIDELASKNHLIEDRLRAIIKASYEPKFNWVKCGGLGKIWHLKGKRLWRLQITESELCGNYYKAWTIDIPEGKQPNLQDIQTMLTAYIERCARLEKNNNILIEN